jgi:hypothetical protein
VGGTYTIEHTVWGASRAVFRIKVPGDNENQPVSSELFKVEVTPAPPGVLHPVAPRKGPREGPVSPSHLHGVLWPSPRGRPQASQGRFRPRRPATAGARRPCA